MTKKIIHWMLISISLTLALVSLFFGNPIVSLIQFLPVVVYYLKSKYPNNRILCEITSPLSPVTKNGMLSSEYSAKMSYFSGKWLAVFVFILSLVITFDFDIEDNLFTLTIFAFFLPIFLGMAFLATVFHTAKYFYIKITGREKIWHE
jgi:hypothetical protein